MVYYVDATLLAAWCELRADYRHFRIERIGSCATLEERFARDRKRLLDDWLARREREAATAP
jgi:predicted DNA-binding transcriptional regulator YafY